MVSRLTVLTLLGLSTGAVNAFHSFQKSSWHRARGITFAEAIPKKKCDPVSCPPPPPPPPKPEAKAATKGGKKDGKPTAAAVPVVKSEGSAVTPVTAEAVTSPGDPQNALYFIGGANVVAGLAYWRQRRTGGDPIAKARGEKPPIDIARSVFDDFIDEFYFRAEKPPPETERFLTEFSFPKEVVAAPEPEAVVAVEEKKEAEAEAEAEVEEKREVVEQKEEVEEKKEVEKKREVEKKVVVVGGQEVVVSGGAGSTPVVSAMEKKTDVAEAVKKAEGAETAVEKKSPAPTQGYGSNPRLVKFTKAFKQMMDGDMGKREFLKSRVYRIARKVNPATTCDDEESCELEIDEADPTLVEMAKEGNF